MSTMIFAFIFMLLLVAGMAVGVILGRKPISGTCGGMKALGMDMDCEICGGDPALCDTGDGATAKNSPLDRLTKELGKRIGD